ncbi:DUF7139 domain-containing protein [Halorientalis pallida]|uniref:Cell division protein A N-terminal domain-containing protein n=1 Tax=Halorientalis pallida TaxID=2479928 RepID=A0A498KRU1_9EURY|nr:hypothetical protein [Halorientalis pallida]RXK46415.1 hypothetical protein EAF64_19175 [Halorientalis pallida]
MPSLSEAYTDRRDRGKRDPRRIALGAAVSLSGAVALVAALLVVTTPLGDLLGATDAIAAKHMGGVLAGLGGPAVLLGVVAVLPSKRRQQVGVVAGSLVAVAGVYLFSLAYPQRWFHAADPLVFETAVVYFVGAFVALWYVFVAVANFRRRNDPHGTVTLEIETGGETRRMEVTPAELQAYRSKLADGGPENVVIGTSSDHRSDGGETDDDIVTEIEHRHDR